MRVLIDARRVGTHGIGRYVASLVDHLPDRRGLDLWLLVREGYRLPHPIPSTVAGLLRCPVDSYDARNGEHVSRTLRTHGFNVYHATQQVLPPRLPCPTVVTIHDPIHVMFPELALADADLAEALSSDAVAGMRSTLAELAPVLSSIERTRLASAPTGYAYAYAMLKHNYLRSDYVKFVSGTVRADVEQLFGPRKRTQVIPNGISSVFFLQNPTWEEEFRSRADVRGGFVLCVARHAPHKNLDGLLAAFSRTRFRSRGGQLVVVGEFTSLTSSLRREAAVLGVGDDVFFLRGLKDRELAGGYSASTCVVSPSSYEGFGFAAAEAMAMRRPIVAVRGGATEEIVGEVALLVDSVQEITEAIDTAVETRRSAPPSRSGQDLARTFCWQRAAEKTLRLYEAAAFRHPAADVA